MTQSQLLRMKMEVTCSPLSDAFRRLWSRPDLDELYASFLIHLHYIMRASVPLMEAALDRCRRAPASDAVAPGLAAYLEKHIPEERHHDEWTLDDLAALGMNRTEVLSTIPPPVMASMVGSQYYWIHHDHPVAILGYISVLEGSPPTRQHVESLRKRTGLPDEAFRTYRLHGQLDPHHREELARALDSLPLSPRQSALVSISAAHTAALLAQAIEDFVDEARPARARRASAAR